MGYEYQFTLVIKWLEHFFQPLGAQQDFVMLASIIIITRMCV